MRAKNLLAAKSPDQLRAIAARLKVDAADAQSLAAAMRHPDVFDRLLRLCDGFVMQEDLFLLCANPFDSVGVDELENAAVFEAAGLIARADAGEFRVNEDIAIAAIPRSPIEFGFAATLLARLTVEERTVVVRASEIGPRPTAVDAILDTAAALRDEAVVMRHVARLPESARAILYDAIERGDLPDDLKLRPGAPSPGVTLDPGPAGQRGLVFWVDQEAADLDPRPVVPLELMSLLPRLMSQVKPPPEVKSSPAPRKRTVSAPRARTRPAEVEPEVEAAPRSGARDPASGSGPRSGLRDPAPGSGGQRGMPESGPARAQREVSSGSGKLPGLRDAPGGSGPLSGVDGAPQKRFMNDPLAASGAAGVGPGERAHGRPAAASLPGGGMPSPFVGRVSSIRSASAMVDLGSARTAEAAAKDEELAAGIVELASEGWVVLRAGIDVRDWAERASLRLAL